MQNVDMLKVDARKLSINLGYIKKIPLYPPLRKGESEGTLYQAIYLVIEKISEPWRRFQNVSRLQRDSRSSKAKILTTGIY